MQGQINEGRDSEQRIEVDREGWRERAREWAALASLFESSDLGLGHIGVRKLGFYAARSTESGDCGYIWSCAKRARFFGIEMHICASIPGGPLIQCNSREKLIVQSKFVCKLFGPIISRVARSISKASGWLSVGPVSSLTSSLEFFEHEQLILFPFFLIAYCSYHYTDSLFIFAAKSELLTFVSY